MVAVKRQVAKIAPMRPQFSQLRLSKGPSPPLRLQNTPTPRLREEPEKQENVEPPKKRGVKDVLKDIGSSVLNWISENGVETLVTLGSALLDSNLAHLTPQLKSVTDNQGNNFTAIPAGTVIFQQPIDASMFDDVNDRLQKMLSLYTYYQYSPSSRIVFKGAQGDLVNGMLAMFICPDPILDINTTDPQQINRLVREYNGTVFKLNTNGSVRIPKCDTPLYVNQSPTEDVRLEKQGTLFVIAFTDIDATLALGELSISFTVRMGKDANTGMAPFGEPVVPGALYMAFTNNAMSSSDFVSNANPIVELEWFTQVPKFPQATKTLGPPVTVDTVFGNTSAQKFYDPVSGLFQPGIYRVKVHQTHSAQVAQATTFCALLPQQRSFSLAFWDPLGVNSPAAPAASHTFTTILQISNSSTQVSAVSNNSVEFSDIIVVPFVGTLSILESYSNVPGGSTTYGRALIVGVDAAGSTAIAMSNLLGTRDMFLEIVCLDLLPVATDNSSLVTSAALIRRGIPLPRKVKVAPPPDSDSDSGSSSESDSDSKSNYTSLAKVEPQVTTSSSHKKKKSVKKVSVE